MFSCILFTLQKTKDRENLERREEEHFTYEEKA
jgi:hypothetical protein